jgi:hypothetical protein
VALLGFLRGFWEKWVFGCGFWMVKRGECVVKRGELTTHHLASKKYDIFLDFFHIGHAFP